MLTLELKIYIKDHNKYTKEIYQKFPAPNSEKFASALKNIFAKDQTLNEAANRLIIETLLQPTVREVGFTTNSGLHFYTVTVLSGKLPTPLLLKKGTQPPTEEMYRARVFNKYDEETQSEKKGGLEILLTPERDVAYKPRDNLMAQKIAEAQLSCFGYRVKSLSVEKVAWWERGYRVDTDSVWIDPIENFTPLLLFGSPYYR